MTEQNFKTSFIPTKSVQPVKKGGDLYTGSKGNMFTIISTIIFLTTLVVAGGVYAYKIKLEKDVDYQNGQINKIRENLEPPFIKEATRMNSRIDNIKLLFDNHVATSQLITLLEETTRQTLQFDSFTYQKQEDGTKKVTINGQALGYATIALQSDSYNETKVLKNIFFSGIQPKEEESGNSNNNLNQKKSGVKFNLSQIIDDKIVSYKEKIIQKINN